MPYENRALLDLAKYVPCQNCGADDGTIVPAHSNLSEHGKGKNLKAHDCFFAALCQRCHGWYDNQGGLGKDPTGVWDSTRADKREMFMRAKDKTLLLLFVRGYLKVCFR